MNGLDALGYMLTEGGKILFSRNEDLKQKLGWKELTTGKRVLMLFRKEALADGWEIGFECEHCAGECVIPVPCPRCSGRSLVSLLENPCCDGWDEAKCHHCEGGIRWEKEY